MDEIQKELYNILKNAVKNCKGKTLALSGGLDSTIIAYFLKKQNAKAIAVISKDFVATDLTYCQIAAKEFQIPLSIKTVSTEKMLSGIENTIRILKNFNDIEIRNSLVMYHTFEAANDSKITNIITGDGADELFAGYSFFLRESEEQLEKDLNRIKKIMHFPTIEIAKFFGINVETPFLDNKVVEFSQTIPVNYKVNTHENKKIGKWILRKTFESKLPKSIVWREKSPMQDGAGTTGLTNLFNSLISDYEFEKRKNEIIENDDVILRTKESLHYYEIYRKYYDAPNKLHSEKTICPYCKNEIINNAKFCRMCGSFPI